MAAWAAEAECYEVSSGASGSWDGLAMGVDAVQHSTYRSGSLGVPGCGSRRWRVVGQGFEEIQGPNLSSTSSGDSNEYFENVTYQSHSGLLSGEFSRSVAQNGCTDDWIQNRGCDVAEHHKWCGYTFFYVKFEPSPHEKVGSQDQRDLSQGSVPLPGSGSSVQGYGGSNSGETRAKQRGQKALQQGDHRSLKQVATYDGGGLSARGSEFIESGQMSGYDLRVLGCERRGEVQATSGRDERSEQGLLVGTQQQPPEADQLPIGERLPPEADQLPIWLSIQTKVQPPPKLQPSPKDPEDLESDGSFEMLPSFG